MNTQNPTQNPNRLLVLDHDPKARELVSQVGYELGFCVSQAATDAQFREQYSRLKPTVILIDPDGLDSAGIEIFSWLAAQPAVASVIAGAVSPEQVKANAAAARWKLSAEDLKEIDRLVA